MLFEIRWKDDENRAPSVNPGRNDAELGRAAVSVVAGKRQSRLLVETGWQVGK